MAGGTVHVANEVSVKEANNTGLSGAFDIILRDN